MTRRDPSHGAQLRVLQVIQDLTYGGAERVVATLSSRLRAEGAEVSVVSAGHEVPGLPDVAVARLPQIERRLDRIPVAAYALRRAVRRERPHVIHAHNPAMALVTAVATARGHTTPALVTVHGVPEEDYRSAARVLRIAGLGVIACGPGVAAALEEHGVRLAGTVVNGVGRVVPHASADELKQSFGLAPELRLAIAVGRLVPQKNHGLALRAVAAVPDAALLVVGDGPLGGELAALAASLGIGDRVRFAGGRSDAPELIASADVLLLSSRWEGLPLVVLEALASGTPVVATAARGVRELVRHEETALLAPLDDIDALASALRQALSNGALAERLRENGLRLAARYGEEEMGDRYLALYRSMAQR
jgi:glycosyltransferase involved in cell wall biosynthesis